MRTKEEIEELVNNIADYIIETKCTTRQAAEHFKVSNYTISEYMNKRLSKSDPRYPEVKQIIDGNRKTLDKDITKIRILKELKFFIEGKTCDEISSIIRISPSQVSRDLLNRLPELIEEAKKSPEDMPEFASLPDGILFEISAKLKENSESNLSIGRNMSVQNQERDMGRFK